MIYSIGLDPGAKGGCAILDSEGRLVKACRMPYDWDRNRVDLKELSYFLHVYWGDETEVFLEGVGPNPSFGSKSQWAFALNFAYLQAMLDLEDWDYRLVNPKQWMKDLKLEKVKPKDKPSVRFAKDKWPGIDLADGVTDAACIALWGLQYGRIAT